MREETAVVPSFGAVFWLSGYIASLAATFPGKYPSGRCPHLLRAPITAARQRRIFTVFRCAKVAADFKEHCRMPFAHGMTKFLTNLGCQVK